MKVNVGTHVNVSECRLRLLGVAVAALGLAVSGCASTGSTNSSSPGTESPPVAATSPSPTPPSVSQQWKNSKAMAAALASAGLCDMPEDLGCMDPMILMGSRQNGGEEGPYGSCNPDTRAMLGVSLSDPVIIGEDFWAQSTDGGVDITEVHAVLGGELTTIRAFCSSR